MNTTDSATLPGWDHFYSGKVRDLFRASDPADARMLLVASDRVSAFDHMLEPAIVGKGAVLTALSRWWFDRLDVPNHFAPGAAPAAVADRAMVVKTLEMHPIECVVRGYLTGSGYQEYLATGAVCGIALPAGLADGDRLPEPIYTPAWKAPLGEHDENISFERSAEIVGEPLARELRAVSLALFAEASAVAEARGLLLADTKFEFGADPETGALTLADEVLTSDSSRYWDAAGYAAGGSTAERLASFDKQIVRDWLSANWDRQGTPPELPAEIVERTLARYRELFERLTGETAPA